MRQADNVDMTGRTVLVTGASSGIGKATAVGLARLGARIAITGRDRGRVASAVNEVRGAGGGEVDGFVADLSSQAQVRRLAGEVLETLPRLDVLVNNVGGYWDTRHTTVDGLERTFALNYLAPFLLTNLLLERLTASAPARVVTVASNVQLLGKLDFQELQGEGAYSGSRAYSQSKVADLFFSNELARRLQGTGVTANALHPGVVNTAFGAEDPGTIQRLLVPFMRPLMKSPSRGAATSILVASAPELEHVTGCYFANGKARKTPHEANDSADALRLWRLSAELVGLGPRGGEHPAAGP